MGNFLGKSKGETEEQEKPALSSPNGKKKRKRSAGTDDDAPGAGVCDDVLLNIFARLPARAAVACMVLSKHHHRLICSPEFRNLHCRLGPPLPCPHIAYVVTAPIKRRPEQEDPVTRFHGFHVPGAGLSDHAPMRTIVGEPYLDMTYVNTCNGIVLLADADFSAPCSCVLWNPAMADAAKEVTVPDPLPELESEYRVLGLGYGRRSKTYKVLLFRKQTHRKKPPHKNLRYSGGGGIRIEYSFVVYTVSNTENQPQLRTVLSDNLDAGISHESLYLDGTIYLLHVEKLFAFDVDDETVTTIDLPGEGARLESGLMEMYGRPCVYMYEGERWLLSLDHRWVQRFVTDNSGVSVAEKMLEAKLPSAMVLDFSNYAICWGYKPTLVSPESIVSVVNQGKERHLDGSAGMLRKLKPISEQDERRGQQATLDTVCFMEFLVSIMQKLPNDYQDVVEMSLTNVEGPFFSAEDRH
ncbi:hypothetical protein EJB05_39495, partial [Eragrostis curvula]